MEWYMMLLQYRARSLVTNAVRDIAVETRRGSGGCEIKPPLDLRKETRVRRKATKTRRESQTLGSRVHQQHRRLVDSPACWACHSVDHFLQAVLASSWVKQDFH